MNGEEEFRAIIQEIKEIYLDLTGGEPTPDDEIEARKKLMEKIQRLKTVNSLEVGANMNLFEKTLELLEDWDTLELWFTESELPEFIQKIITIIDKTLKVEKREEKEEKIEAAETNSVSSQIDIGEIVDKVSEQFKGEIETLKERIELLKEELEKKDEKLDKVSNHKIVKKIIPQKESKLPPPTIKIPSIKTPNISPKVEQKRVSLTEKIKERIETKVVESKEPKFTPLPKEKPKISTNVIEEPLKESKVSKPENPDFISNLKPKITSVSVEEVEEEHIKSSGEDLFNVFSSVGGKEADKFTSSTPKLETIESKEMKQNKDTTTEKVASSFIDFNASKSKSSSNIEEIATDKDTLYQELIALEGRRYSLEKNFKDLDKRYTKGSIDDFEYKSESDDLKIKLSDITSRINKIRRIIASL
jgi:hypothetical protein